MDVTQAAELIRQSVPAERMAVWYGLSPKQGYICCPFHHETSPSLKFYRNGSWHCFGCHLGGSVFDFVMQMESCSFSDAVACINDALSLGLLSASSSSGPDPISLMIIEGSVHSMLADIDREADLKEQEISEWFPCWLAIEQAIPPRPSPAEKEVLLFFRSKLETLMLEKEMILAGKEDVYKWKAHSIQSLRRRAHAASS